MTSAVAPAAALLRPGTLLAMVIDPGTVRRQTQARFARAAVFVGCSWYPARRLSGSPRPSRSSRSPATSSPPAPPAAKRASAPAIAAWGLAIFAGTRLAAILLEAQSMAAAVAAAVIAEWGAGRLDVAWTDPKAADAGAATGPAIAKRALTGAAIGALVAGAVAVFLVATRAVVLSRTAPAMPAIVVMLLTAGLYAMRDELVLHGVVLRAIEAGSSTSGGAIAKVVACGITSAAAAFGDGGSARAVAVQGLLGLVLGALWVRDRGAWPAWGASAAFRFTADLLFAGGLYQAGVATSAWGGGDAGALGGSAAIVALLPFGAAAVVWAARRAFAPGPAQDAVRGAPDGDA
jgi:hypothetical protein